MPENMLIGLDWVKDGAFLWGATPALASPVSGRSAGQNATAPSAVGGGHLFIWGQKGWSGRPSSPCPVTLGMAILS